MQAHLLAPAVRMYETVMCRLLADELEPAVAKVKESVDKLPEAARKVRCFPLSLTVISQVKGELRCMWIPRNSNLLMHHLALGSPCHLACLFVCGPYGPREVSRIGRAPAVALGLRTRSPVIQS